MFMWALLRAAFSKLVAFMERGKPFAISVSFSKKKISKTCWRCCFDANTISYNLVQVCILALIGQKRTSLAFTLTVFNDAKVCCIYKIWVTLNYLSFVLVCRPVFPFSRYCLRRSYRSRFAADVNYQQRKKRKKKTLIVDDINKNIFVLSFDFNYLFCYGLAHRFGSQADPLMPCLCVVLDASCFRFEGMVVRCVHVDDVSFPIALSVSCCV